MAFNLGAALGAAAESGASMYTRLKDIEDKKSERAQRQQLIDLQLKEDQRKQLEFDQKQAENQAVNNANTATLGQVNKPSMAPSIQENTGVGPVQAQGLAGNSGDTEFDKAVAQSDVNTLNQNAQAQGQAIPTQTPVAPRALSMDEARQRYAQALYANPNISPERASALQATQQQLQLGGYQLNEAARKQEAQKTYDTESKKLFELRSKLISQDPVKDPEGFLKEMRDDYTKFHPGDKVDYVHGKFIVTDTTNPNPKTNTKFYTPEEAHANLKGLLDNHISTQMSMMLGSPEAYLNQFNKSKELGLKEQEVKNTGAYQDVMGRAALQNANSTAILSQAHAGVYNNMLKVSETNEAARNAMQPSLEAFAKLTPEQQMGKEGEAILLQAATAGAKVSKDITPLITALRKPERVISPEREKAAYKELENARGNKQLENAVKADYPDVFGKDKLLEAVEKAVEKTGDKSQKVSETPKKEAIPVEQKLIRSPNPRGGYTYTPSPRGMTRAEWDKLDQSKQAIPAQ